jgi:hypothetical protein
MQRPQRRPDQSVHSRETGVRRRRPHRGVPRPGQPTDLAGASRTVTPRGLNCRYQDRPLCDQSNRHNYNRLER